MSTAPARSGLLEWSPLLDARIRPLAVSLYPQAGEGAIVRRTSQSPRDEAPAKLCAKCQARRLRARAAHNAKVHEARAKAKLRRWIRANRCRFLWTLTYADPRRTLDEVVADLEKFQRRMRDRKGKLRMAFVAEPHPGGHGFHLHMATDRFVSVELVRKLWGHGHVFVGDPKKLAGRVASRKLAAYMAKYLGKQLDGAAPAPGVTPRRARQHRYWLTQGYDPVKVSRYVATYEAGLDWLRDRMGAYDVAIPFAVAGVGEADSAWFSWPDRCLWPAPP